MEASFWGCCASQDNLKDGTLTSMNFKTKISYISTNGLPSMKKFLNFVPSTKEATFRRYKEDQKSNEELAFMVPEDSMQASKGERQPIALPRYDAYEPHQ